MATVLNDFDFGTRAGGNRYPWDEWLDGQIRKLTEDDFDGKPPSKYFANQAKNVAKRRGLKCKVSVNHERGEVVIQAIKGDNGEAPAAADKSTTKKGGKGRKS